MDLINGRYLSMVFGTIEVNAVTTSVLLDNEDADADTTTFADVISGNDETWFLQVAGVPDYGPGTWWSLLWEQPPYEPIPYQLRPWGNAVPTPEKPHFTGECTVDRLPPIGGDAATIWKFDTRLTCTARPTRVVA